MSEKTNALQKDEFELTTDPVDLNSKHENKAGLERLRDSQEIYKKALNLLFGSVKEPKYPSERFAGAVDAKDQEAIVKVLKVIIQAGINFCNVFKDISENKFAADKELALLERARDTLVGPRRTMDSLSKVIDMIAIQARNLAMETKNERIDKLYDEQQGIIFLGALLYGKEGLLWNVGGSQIAQFHQDQLSHIEGVKDTTSEMMLTMREKKT